MAGHCLLYQGHSKLNEAICKPIFTVEGWEVARGVCVYFPQCVYTDYHLSLFQDCEQASCKMNSLGSNHSLPSTSVSTGSQSSSVNSMQEVLDESCSDMTMMHHDYDSTLESSAHTKKVTLTEREGEKHTHKLAYTHVCTQEEGKTHLSLSVNLQVVTHSKPTHVLKNSTNKQEHICQ